MIKFYKERLDYKLYEELLPLLEASREEVYCSKENLTLAKSMELSNINSSNVDINYFLDREKNGFLNICTMRDNNKLVGHWTTILDYHAQSKTLLVATTSNIHVYKEYRGINSIKFMKYTEEVLKKRGVKLLYMAVNPHLKQEKLLNKMGFTIDEVVYSKGI